MSFSNKTNPKLVWRTPRTGEGLRVRQYKMLKARVEDKLKN